MIDSMVTDTPHATMVFEDMGGGMTIIQVEVPADSDKALSDQETTTFGGLKAGYR
jgi:hypothetical protein